MCAFLPIDTISHRGLRHIQCHDLQFCESSTLYFDVNILGFIYKITVLIQRGGSGLEDNILYLRKYQRRHQRTENEKGAQKGGRAELPQKNLP